MNDDEEAKNLPPSSPLQKPNHSSLHLPFASIPGSLLGCCCCCYRFLVHCPYLTRRTHLRPTLHEGSRSRDQWIQAILLVESFKLSQGLYTEGSRPKSGKVRLNLHGTSFGGKINWLWPKNSAKRRAHDLENQESGYSLLTQGFNLLQISPNWFLGNWTMDLCLKQA